MVFSRFTASLPVMAMVGISRRMSCKLPSPLGRCPLFHRSCLVFSLRRDIAGQVVNPVWDPDAQGILATLSKAFGPGGDLLTSFGHEVLKSESPPKIGFSADILFKANNKQVTEITRVLSLDLVYDPARGGGVLSFVP
jgi:hypothetical protein